MDNFELCLKLRDAGLTQERREGSYYWVRPDTLIRIDDIGLLRDSTKGNKVNYSEFAYYPTLDDLFSGCGLALDQIIRMADGGWCVYSPANYYPQDLKVRGKDLWSTLAGFFIATKEKEAERAISDDSI